MQPSPTSSVQNGAVHLLRSVIACLTIASSQAFAQTIRITEFTYNAGSGEFIELTNVGSTATDLAGWSIDDEDAIPGSFDLSSAGIVAPGESIVVTTAPAAAFRAAWSLGPSQPKVLGDNDTAKLSRTDTIFLFNQSGAEVDRLGFSDVNYEYSVRAKDTSAWVCSSAIGQDDPYGWRLSALGDGQGSTVSIAGDVGSPGTHAAATCDPLVIGTSHCDSRPNSTGFVGTMAALGNPIVSRNSLSLRVSNLPANAAGLAIMSRLPTLVQFPGGSQGILCVGNGFTRLNSLVSLSSPNGEWSADLDIANPATQNLPTVLQAETWYFQLWHRDANPSLTSNFSTGWTINFH